MFCWCSRFWSAVTKTSKTPLARRSSSPFFIDCHPCSGTVTTSKPSSSPFRPRGSDSSRRIRTQRSKGSLARKLQELNRLLPSDSRELCKECVQGITRLEIVEKRLDRDAGSSEYRDAAHHLG